MKQYAAFYAIMKETTTDGVYVDHPYLAGITKNEKQANELIRAIINDPTIPGAIIPYITPYDPRITTIANVQRKATTHFNKMSTGIYDREEQLTRRR